MQIKRFRFSKAINFRDMGGVYAENGKIVRWNTLYRSDKFNGTSPNEWEKMKNEGIRTIIDLRSQVEVDISPDKCPGYMNFIHFPIVEENLSFDNLESPDMQAFAKSVNEGYKNIVLNHGENVAKSINIITNCIKDGGVVFHCTSGKDRTGIVAAIIYYMLGVDEQDIVADYQTSYTYNKIKSDEFMNDNPQYKKYISVVLSDAENMYELLDLFRKIDIKKYLISKGLNIEKFEKFKKYILV